METSPPEVDAIRQQLIADIERAFRDVQRDDGITLHETEVIDAYGSEEDQRAARERDTESRWQDVPTDVIDSHTGLYFLDLYGFRYYLPAYMTRMLASSNSSQFAAGDSLMLTIVQVGASHQEWHGWANIPEAMRNPLCACRFSAQQRAVVRQFLEYIILVEPDLADADTASTALKDWEQVEQRIATEVDHGQQLIVQCVLLLPDGTISSEVLGD